MSCQQLLLRVYLLPALSDNVISFRDSKLWYARFKIVQLSAKYTTVALWHTARFGQSER